MEKLANSRKFISHFENKRVRNKMQGKNKWQNQQTQVLTGSANLQPNAFHTTQLMNVF